MKIIYFLIAGLSLSNALRLTGAEASPLSENESHQIRQNLEAFERGMLTLDQISGPEYVELAALTNITTYFMAHSNEVTLKMLLPISRSFVVTGNSSDGALLAKKYLNVYSNECRAWDILLGAQSSAHLYGEALQTGTNALRLGCENNIVIVGILALDAGRNDLMENMIVPRLLVLKDTEKGVDKKREMLNVLVMHSVNTTNRALFVKSLRGVTLVDLKANPHLRGCVRSGCRLFDAKETEKLCDELTEMLRFKPHKENKLKTK